MKIVAGLCFALILATIAGAIGGWVWFGVIAVVGAIVMISVTTRNSGAPAGGAGSTPAAGSGGSKKSQAVAILENIGGIVAIVVFGFLAITLLGMIRDCGGVVKEGWDRLDEVYTGDTTPITPHQPPPAKKEVALGEDHTFPAGTALHFIATGENCEEWQLRTMNKKLKEKESLVQWFTVKERDFYWTLNREGWVDARTQTGCNLTVEQVQ